MVSVTALRPYLRRLDRTLDPDAPLWLDRPDARRRILQTAPDDRTAAAAEAMHRDGLCILPEIVPADRIDAMVEEVAAYRRDVPPPPELVADGLAPRLTNIHIASPAARDVIFTPALTATLDYLLDARTMLYSSLQFEAGSQQMIHRDGPYFATDPRTLFFGVWIALEDVHPDAGPLLYYPGGHRFPISLADVAAAHAHEPAGPDRGLAMILDYWSRVGRRCHDLGLRRHRLEGIPKGTVAVWHAELPHGGAGIRDPQRTRRSFVCHVKPEGVPLYGWEAFFDQPHDPPPPESISHHGDRALVDNTVVDYAASDADPED